MTGRKGPEHSKISELIKGLVYPAQPPAHLFHESHAFIEASLGSATSKPQQGLPPHPGSDTLLYALQVRAETRLLFVQVPRRLQGERQAITACQWWPSWPAHRGTEAHPHPGQSTSLGCQLHQPLSTTMLFISLFINLHTL